MTDDAQTPEALAAAAIAVAADAPTEADLIEARNDAEIERIEAQADAQEQIIMAQAAADVAREQARQGSPELVERIAQCENRMAALEAQVQALALTPAPSPAPAVVVTSTPPTPPETPEPASPPTPDLEAPTVPEASPSAAADGQRESLAAPPPPAKVQRFRKL